MKNLVGRREKVEPTPALESVLDPSATLFASSPAKRMIGEIAESNNTANPLGILRESL
jgi:hypothetical protein